MAEIKEKYEAAAGRYKEELGKIAAEKERLANEIKTCAGSRRIRISTIPRRKARGRSSALRGRDHPVEGGTARSGHAHHQV